MLIETLSVFPEMFEPVMSTSILGRARKAGLFDFKAYNLRDWTHDRHRTVDDEPYGGGQGMLMKVEPIAEAIEAISAEGPKPTVVFFTPCGEPFTQHVAERLLKSERLLFVCSRYEGVDERAYAYADERLSIGDYVLTGGELAACIIADSVVRIIPGAIGDEASALTDSFQDNLWRRRSTRARPSSAAGGFPTCCSRATSPRSPGGRTNSPSNAPGSCGPTCWANKRMP